LHHFIVAYYDHVSRSIKSERGGIVSFAYQRVIHDPLEVGVSMKHQRMICDTSMELVGRDPDSALGGKLRRRYGGMDTD